MRKLMISVAAIVLVACRTHAAEPAKVEPVVAKPVAGEPAAAAPKEDGLQVIILGGGKEAAEAEAWTKRWEDDVAALYREVIELQEGYPRTVRSDDLPGLNPGYEIAILGICKSHEVAAPLDIVRSIYPGAYVKKLAGVQAEACPELPTQAKVYAREVVKQQDGWRLAVNIYFRQAGLGNNPGERRDPPDPKSGYLEVIATVFDAEGTSRGYERSVYESMPDLLDNPSSCELRLVRSSRQIVLRAACDMTAGSCSGNPTRLVEELVFRIRGMTLDHKRRVLEKQEAPLCD